MNSTILNGTNGNVIAAIDETDGIYVLKSVPTLFMQGKHHEIKWEWSSDGMHWHSLGEGVLWPPKIPYYTRQIANGFVLAQHKINNV